MRRLLFTLFLLLFISTSTSAWAGSSVWKAQKGSTVIYLGGTLHILRESDFPLPPEFDRAYRAADLLMLETDMGKLQDPEVQQRMLLKSMYTDGSTVREHLSPSTYGVLRAYCESRGFPLESFGQFKPAMLMMTLTVMELMKLGVSMQGVDQFYYNRAKEQGKPVQGLETVDQQLDYVVSMADGVEDEFVTYSLEEMATIEEQFGTLTEAWRSGNDAQMNELMVAPLKDRQPDVYRKLITQRNNNWMPRITALEKGRRTALVLVGMAHLVGPDGLLTALRKKGYTVHKL